MNQVRKCSSHQSIEPLTVESSLILIFEVRANRVKIEDFRPSSESSQARARLSISNESCRMSQVKTRLAPSCQISTGGPRLTRFPVTRFHFTRAGIYQYRKLKIRVSQGNEICVRRGPGPPVVAANFPQLHTSKAHCLPWLSNTVNLHHVNNMQGF